MRNSFVAALIGVAAVGCIYVSRPAADVSATSPIPAERADYVALFNQRLAAFPRVEDKEGKDRMEPDMFHEFDKLQRMDPATGEVPADGYTRAWRYIQRTWDVTTAMPTGRSGYALQWEERGPSTVGGRTRAILWNPNSATGRALFAGGVGGGLWHTYDITASSPTWTNVSPVFSNVAVTCINYDPSNTLVMYYGTGEGWFNADAIRGAGVWKSTDGGFTWDVLPATQNSIFYYCQDIIVTNDGTLYVATKGGLQRSTDGGQSFTKVLGSGTGMGQDFITDLEVDGNDNLFAAISGSGIYRSLSSLGANQGTQGNWTRFTTSFPAGYGRIELAVGKSNSNYLYAVTEAGNAASDVYRSTNAGSTWGVTPGQPANGNDFSNGQAWYDLCLEVSPTNHLVIYTGGIDQWRSTNGGSSWTQLTAAYGFGAPYMHPDQHNIAVNPTNSNQVIFSNDGGIHFSSSQGSNPDSRNSGYNVTQFYTLAINPKLSGNQLIGGTQDNGSIMVDQSGVGPGIDLTGADGSYCAINPNFPDTMYTTSQWEPVYRSRNGGGTFTGISNQNLDESNTLFINPIEIDPANPNVLYQASTSLWRHPNATSGGAGGWVRVTTNLGSNITAIAPATTPGNRVYFSAGGTIYILNNAHQANSSTVPVAVNPSGAASGYVNCILVNPTDGNHIIVTYSSFGLTRRVMECRDAHLGATATWKDLTGNLPDLPCNWAAFEPTNPNGILVGTDMGIFRCADITQASVDIYWSPESMGLGWPRVSMLKTKYSDNSIHAATHGRGFFSTWSYNNPPSANFGIGGTVACGGAIQFFDSTSNAPISWAWNFGDGNSSSLQSPVHVYAASGTYNVTLTATNPNGNSTTSQTVTVTVLPSATASAGPDQSACPGDTIQLGASGGVSYAWSPSTGLNNPNIPNPMAVVTGNRTYFVTVTDSNGCSAVDTMIVTQLQAPNVWAGQDQTITTTGGSVQLQGSGAVTYTWSPSTGLSCTNCPNPVANPTTTTVYSCTGANAQGCERTDQVTVFVNIVGVADALKGAALTVAPNPVQDRTRLTYTLAESGKVVLDLVDLQGRTVARMFEGEQAAGDHHVGWERGATLSAGVYFVRLVVNGNSVSKKIVLE